MDITEKKPDEKNKMKTIRTSQHKTQIIILFLLLQTMYLDDNFQISKQLFEISKQLICFQIIWFYVKTNRSARNLVYL